MRLHHYVLSEIPAQDEPRMGHKSYDTSSCVQHNGGAWRSKKKKNCILVGVSLQY